MYVRSIAMERGATPRDRKAVVCWGTNATAEATSVAKRIARKDCMVAVLTWTTITGYDVM
jgi:hypothetical protein